MYQDDEYGKNVFDGFTAQLTAMNLKAASVTTYKRGVSDFSAQAAKMKSDGCDLVVMRGNKPAAIGGMDQAGDDENRGRHPGHRTIAGSGL